MVKRNVAETICYQISRDVTESSLEFIRMESPSSYASAALTSQLRQPVAAVDTYGSGGESSFIPRLLLVVMPR